MNAHHAVAVSLLALASAGLASVACAQGLTRAEVHEQLIQAEQNGLQFVTDTSYPEVSPVFAQQVARQKMQAESTGGRTAGSSEAGAPVMHAPMPAADCVGPVGYCTPYFGN